MDAIGTIVKHVVDTEFENLPVDTVSVTKKLVLDLLGAVIAGSSVTGCGLLMTYVRECRGPRECTVPVFGFKTPASLAALATGAMARAREIDDVSDVRPLHPSASVIPAALAMSEKLRTITGRDFLTAVALGQDLVMRFSVATAESPVVSGRYNLFKVFACVAAAGKLLRLTEDQLWNAMGIAYSQMPGDMQALTDGVMTTYVAQGMRAKSAIEAVLMAQKGITGSRNVLQGQFGFFKAFEPNPDLDALTGDLGARFSGQDISIKFYGGCRFTHQPIELAQSFFREGLRPEEIKQVTVRCAAECYKLVGQPLEAKQRPRTIVDGNFSIPFTVATALVKGDVFIEQVNDRTIKDPLLLDIASRVTPVIDTRCEVPGQVVGSVIMELETRDGRTQVKSTRFPRGNPGNPASMDDCTAKFRKAAAYSREPFADKQLSNIISMVNDLENMGVVNELIRALVPRQ